MPPLRDVDSCDGGPQSRQMQAVQGNVPLLPSFDKPHTRLVPVVDLTPMSTLEPATKWMTEHIDMPNSAIG